MRILLCDDVKKDRLKYQRLLEGLCHKYDIDGQFETFQNGYQLIMLLEDHHQATDLLFLDIHMPNYDGISVAVSLRNNGFVGEIVFLTNSLEHWSEAFDVNAFHYLVKNQIDEKKMEEIFLKVVDKISKKEEKYIRVSSGYETRQIPLSQIRYFEIRNRIITVYYGDNEFEFYSTLGTIEQKMLPYGFVRPHRSFLVALSYIEHANYQNITLRDGMTIPVGRAYYKNFKEELQHGALI